MTKKQAKEWLLAIQEKYIHGGDDEMDAKRKEAIDMAIKALEQEPSVWDDKGELTDYGEKCREYILEQQPCDKYIKEIDHLRKYIYKLETQIVEQEPCDTRQAVIVRCKDCRKHNVSVGYQNDCCPLYEFRGISYGHEHDYQFCCYAERRTDE